MSEQSSHNAVRLTVTNTEPTDPNGPYAQPQELNHLSHLERIFVGRSPSNDISCPAASVSGKHACILRQGDDYFVCDLQSRNGTFLNNAQLTPNEQHPLRSGDLIRISPYEIVFHNGIDVLGSGNTENTAMLQQQLIENVLGGLLGHAEVPPKIVLVSGFPQHHILELPTINTEYKIGRSPHCDLVVQDENMSREHAHLRRSTRGVFVRDNNSRNGVVLNGNRLPRNTEVKIKDRDEFVLGTIKFRFEDPEGAQFEEKVGEVVQEPEPVAAPPSISVPMPSTPPPEPFGAPPPSDPPPGEEGEMSNPADLPPPPGSEGLEGEEGAEGLEGEEGFEGEEGEGEPGPPPPPPGLTGGQKAVIFGLVALLVVGGALLFFLTNTN